MISCFVHGPKWYKVGQSGTGDTKWDRWYKVGQSGTGDTKWDRWYKVGQSGTKWDKVVQSGTVYRVELVSRSDLTHPV